VPAEQLDYECVICTRNRPQALRMSVPLLLAQTRPPRRVIVADSSDDHEEIRRLVAEISTDAPCEVVVLSSPRGSSVQRNEGLKLVEADVVFFPDDDSLCDPDFAEHVMRIYERDADRVIGGVTGTHRARMRDSEDVGADATRMAPGPRLRQLISPARGRLERKLVLDPLVSISWQIRKRWTVPDWLREVDGQPNCWVRGCRMTFRTEVIRAAEGFDEHLRDYATFEDVHLGFSIGRTTIIAQAMGAMVFHMQFPGGRGSGRIRGATNIANRAYVVACHSERGSVNRRRVVTFGAYRCLLYGAGGLWSAYHRDSFRGAFAVLRRLRPLLLAAPEHAGEAYQSLLARAGIG
jgi:glycosyltransferase involved in cell wall biosynthesis